MDWYSYTTSGVLKDPKLVKQHFDQLPEEVDLDEEDADDAKIREFLVRTLGPDKASCCPHDDDQEEELNATREIDGR